MQSWWCVYLVVSWLRYIHRVCVVVSDSCQWIIRENRDPDWNTKWCTDKHKMLHFINGVCTSLAHLSRTLNMDLCLCIQPKALDVCRGDWWADAHCCHGWQLWQGAYQGNQHFTFGRTEGEGPICLRSLHFLWITNLSFGCDEPEEDSSNTCT